MWSPALRVAVGLPALGLLAWALATALHAAAAPALWLAVLAVGLALCPGRGQGPGDERTAGFALDALLVAAVAAALRLYRIDDLPVGPYLDEIITLGNAAALSDAPLDVFGSTPLLRGRPDWVHTQNLYLYFNWLLLRAVGVGHLGMKLFSVVPGVLACVCVLGAARELFARRTALGLAVLFAFGHWPVRLSRYGWDVSFLVMTFAGGLWLLLRARRRGDVRWAYASGAVTGVGLYGYLGARVCLLSLLCVVGVDWLTRRDQASLRRAAAFVAGAVLAALPLLLAYTERPELVWVRAGELSILDQPSPVAAIARSAMRHALMFHVAGGAYARDNHPAYPMLDGVTGLLMLIGVWVLLRRDWRERGWVIFTLLGVNLLAGVLSVSQEGAPYVYRAAPAMVPAFLVVGYGLEWLRRAEPRGIAAGAALALAFSWNVWLYFGCERANVLAARVTAYELRLIADEARRTPWPLYALGDSTLAKRIVWDGSVRAPPRYLDRNPSYGFIHQRLALRAVRLLSGRWRGPASPGEPPVLLVHDDALEDLDGAAIAAPALLVFRPGGPGEAWVRRRHPDVRIRIVDDVRGGEVLGVASIERQAAKR